jgi:hypothetical protein
MLLPRIIDLAFEQPAMAITDIAVKIGVSYQAAPSCVAVLVICPLLSGPKLMIFWTTKEI